MIRSVSVNVRPPVAREAPLCAAVRPAADSFVRDSGIGVNHVLHVVDAGTRAALGDPQGFLATHFAGVSIRSGSDGNGGTWTGTYITGRRSYIEIFDPSVFNGGAIHAQSGLLLGADTTASFEHLRRDLLAIKDPRFTVSERTFPPKPPYWIRAVELTPPVREVFCWMMAYGDGSSRQSYNTATYKPQMYLDDITGVAVTLTVNEHATLSALADKCGFTKTGNAYANDQVRFEVTETADQAKSGVTAITMSLTDNARRDRSTIADTTHAFGKASLHITKDCSSATLRLPLKA